jgi:hypothetical protein
MRRMSISCVTLLAACALPPPDAALTADRCEARVGGASHRSTAQVTVGTNSRSGGFYDASVGVTFESLQGLDPVQAYERCVFERTGELPIRPPVLPS